MNEKKGVKHRYIFPNPLAKLMKEVDTKTQFESSMLSMALLLLGMLLMSVYTMIYVDQGMVFKVLLVINILAGFLFMSSFMVTTYQQYCSYMDAMEIQGIKPGTEGFGPKIPQKKNKRNQFLFFGGLILILVSITIFFVKADAGSIYTYKNFIAIGLLLLGVIMCALVFKKKKPEQQNSQIINPGKIKKISIATKATYAAPITSNENIASLMEDIKSGLSTLKSLPNTTENEPMRGMISEAIQSKMADLKRMKGGSK